MARGEEPDFTHLDPAERVRALSERGIAQARAGEGIAAVISLKEAEQIALDAGLASLAIGAHIDRGWALWLGGEAAGAAALYAEGAQMARDAGDAARLRVALGNLGIAYSHLGRPADALSTYEEYLPLLVDDPAEAADAHLNAGSALVSLDRADEAGVHFDTAERLAEAAGLIEPRVVVNLNRGVLLERSGDIDAAFERYWQAFDLAEEAKDADLIGRTTLTLGRAYTRAGDHTHACDCLGEAARAFRHEEDKARLVEALRLQGAALQAVGLIDAALEAWDEEDAILRERRDDLALGDCVLRKALMLAAQSTSPGVELLFVEAADLFRSASATDRLAEVYQAHAQLLRDRGRDEEAAQRLEQAFGALAEAPNPGVESRARGLRALMLADAGECEAAAQELDAAEAIAGGLGDWQALTGLRARRAYVLAREGRPLADVVAQLRAAAESAASAGSPGIAERAVNLVANEITVRCGDEYRDVPAEWPVATPS